MSIRLLQMAISVSEHPLWKEQIKARIALRDINLKHWLESNIFSPASLVVVVNIIYYIMGYMVEVCK